MSGWDLRNPIIICMTAGIFQQTYDWMHIMGNPASAINNLNLYYRKPDLYFKEN